MELEGSLWRVKREASITNPQEKESGQMSKMGSQNCYILDNSHIKSYRILQDEHQIN